MYELTRQLHIYHKIYFVKIFYICKKNNRRLSKTFVFNKRSANFPFTYDLNDGCEIQTAQLVYIYIILTYKVLIITHFSDYCKVYPLKNAITNSVRDRFEMQFIPFSFF